MFRVATQDAESATRLMQFLVESVHAKHVWLDSHSGEVCVDDRAEIRQMGRVLNGIERWLTEAGIGAVEVCVGDRAYRMERPAELASR